MIIKRCIIIKRHLRGRKNPRSVLHDTFGSRQVAAKTTHLVCRFITLPPAVIVFVNYVVVAKACRYNLVANLNFPFILVSEDRIACS